MARHEADREDLIHEATALCPRVEWQVVGEPGIVFAGLKRTGALSIYFDQDPVYQFDEHGRLRRAYVDGCLYRSDGQTLARLQRERSATQTMLLRRDLTPTELTAFQARLHRRVAALEQRLRSGEVTELRHVADGALPDFAALLATALEQAFELAPAIAPARPRR